MRRFFAELLVSLPCRFWRVILSLACSYLFIFFKDHVVKSAAGHFAIKRLINQDKERLQLGSKGKVPTERQKTKEQKY